MSATTMTGINPAQHIVQSLNPQVRADDDSEDNLIDPKAVDKLREIETKMTGRVYREKSESLVGGSFFPSAFKQFSTLLPKKKKEKKQFSTPSLHFPPNKSETINSCLVINGIAMDERFLGGIAKMGCIQAAVETLQSNRIYDLMFNGTDDYDQRHFNSTLIDFSRAVALGGRSPENLFRILDTYDAMADAMVQLDDCSVIHLAKRRLTRLGSGGVRISEYFDKKIFNFNKINGSQTDPKCWDVTNAHMLFEGNWTWTLKNGDIHPLTQAMMNYMKLIVDYSDTQNLLEIGEDDDRLDALRNHDSNSLKMNPVARELLAVINFLESNLKKKSKLHEDGGLQYIFLVNNILYMKQRGKDLDLGGLLGDNWVRKQHGQITQYAMSYLRASWTKVLDCLKNEGLCEGISTASRVAAVKERIKNFNACFEEIYRVQTAWKVPDAQLREELRIFILQKVLPAYNSFMSRFGWQILEVGSDAGEYIKYTADDLESYLFNLFEGAPRVLHGQVEEKCIG